MGARPQFIKAAMVSRAIRDYRQKGETSSIREIIIHTGQHYDFNMSDIFFQELQLPKPDINLNIGSDGHGAQTGKMLVAIEMVLIAEQPDVVLVYGDTNTTLAGALVAAKLHIPVAHVEAGLRSFNKKMPEEINRVLTDHCAAIPFCPTKVAVENLRREGFTNILNDGALIDISPSPHLPSLPVSSDQPLVINIGDVMYDLLLSALPLAEKTDIIGKLSLKPHDYMVLTLHRAENVDDQEQLKKLLEFISELDSARVIFPVHPRTRKNIDKINFIPENIEIIDPVSYLEMLNLMKYAKTVLTDSGGVQKEAFWLKVPCITLRDETEWVETVESGWNVLYRNFRGGHEIKTHDPNLYGDGNTATRIIHILMHCFHAPA